MKCLSFTIACLLLTSSALAQPPRGNQGGNRGDTDRRLRALFERADGDNDKMVTQEELQTLLEKESKNQDNRPRMGHGGPGEPGNFDGGPGGPGGPGRFGGRPGGGPGGFGGPGGGPGGPVGDMRPPMPKPGTVLPDFLIGELRLSTKQSDELAELQKMVDERLASILTKEQQDQLKQMEGGPGRPGGPGGFGPGGFGPGGFGPGRFGPGRFGPGGRGPGGRGPGGFGPGGPEGAPNDNQPRRPARE